ncbi:MAG: hypothetical protein KBT34_10720 [Prevotella sp.]|nr:hypothetical protein [Candidatus Prevotella equi]
MIQFQNLRQGSQVFILHKGMTPYYEVGTVEQIPAMQMMGYYQSMIPLDITVRVNEQLIPYRQIPPTAESAKVTSQTTGEEVCLACSKEAINAEVDMLTRQSIDAINSVPMHEQRIKTLQQIHDQLNPEKVKEAQQAQEIDSLKGQVTDLSKMVAELTAQLKEKNGTSSFQNNGGTKR